MMKTTRGKSTAKTRTRVLKKLAKKSGQAIHQQYKFPDLTEFRKSIKVKGEPLSRMIIKSRG